MPIAGRVAAVTLAPGTPVAKGQVVARIVQTDLDLAVREAEAALARLEAAVRESRDTSVEETALRQAEEHVKSAASTVAAASARADSSQARLDYAEKQLHRTRRLAETGVRTEDDLERAIHDEISSRLGHQQDVLQHAAIRSFQTATDLTPQMVRQYIARKGLGAEVQERQKAEALVKLEQAKLQWERGVMRSPVDGVVLARHATSEGHLAAGTLLLEIGRPEDLEVEADVLSVEAVRVKACDRVEIYGPAIGPGPVRGAVERVYPAGFTKTSSLGVEQQRVKVIVRFDPGDLARIRKEQSLGVGYRVRVRLQTAEKSEALVVPRSALFRGPDGQWQLYAVRDGRAVVQEVERGLSNDDFVEVLAGLDEGDLVIPSPRSNLADGRRVRPVVRPATSGNGRVALDGD
jgi:HlyD family secretion protein